MKRLLLAALIAGGLACDAVPPYRPCRRAPHKTRQRYKVSWKQIAAGGGAVGTVVAAYKVSDGVQQGMKHAAEKWRRPSNRRCRAMCSIRTRQAFPARSVLTKTSVVRGT